MNSRNKGSLSPSRRHLLELLQRINFGHVKGLRVVKAEPVLDPNLVIVRKVKLGSENGARPELGMEDFLLKREVVNLFAFFDEFQNGAMGPLEIKHGLPFGFEATEVPA